MPIKELWVDLEPEDDQTGIKAKRKVLNKVLQGNWNTLLKGHGMEFAGFRPYTYDDDASLIDWKATLRSDQILVREFEEYKNFNIYVLLDVSDHMLFSSREKLKAEYGAELAFSLCDAILKAGDAVGMGMFTDKVHVNIPPNIGMGSYYQIRKALQNPENYGGGSDLKKVLRYINAYATTPALIILISDFVNLEPGWEKYVELIAHRMDIMGIMLRDPRDRAFPVSGGQFELQDPKTGRVMLVDVKKASKAYLEHVTKEEKAIESAFSKTRSGFVKLTTDKDMYDPLLKYFYKRGRVVEH